MPILLDLDDRVCTPSRQDRRLEPAAESADYNVVQARRHSNVASRIPLLGNIEAGYEGFVCFMVLIMLGMTC